MTSACNHSPKDACRQEHALGARELRGEEPGEDAVGLRLGVEHLEGEGEDYDPNQGADRGLQRSETPPLQLQYPEGPDGGEEPRRKQGYAEEEVEGERGPDELGEVGGHGDHLRLHPKPERDGPREPLSAHLGEVFARGDPQLGRHRLDEHRHQVGDQYHPQEQVPVARPARDVGGEVARVHVGYGRDERRPEERPELAKAAPLPL